MCEGFCGLVTKERLNHLFSIYKRKLFGFTFKLPYPELEKTDGNLHMAVIAHITSRTSESETYRN